MRHSNSFTYEPLWGRDAHRLLQNSQFFLKIGLAWLAYARGAQASHARLSLVSLSVFTLVSDLTARACLNSQKYGLFCSLEKVNQSINQSIRLSVYLFILNFANIGRVTATTAGLAKKVRLFGGSYWQFRLSRFLISVAEISYSVFDYQKIKETWVWWLSIQCQNASIYSQLYIVNLLYARSIKRIAICTFYKPLFV